MQSCEAQKGGIRRIEVFTAFLYPLCTLMDEEGFFMENTDIIIERLWRRKK
jgi:hypothetical protein